IGAAGVSHRAVPGHDDAPRLCNPRRRFGRWFCALDQSMSLQKTVICREVPLKFCCFIVKAPMSRFLYCMPLSLVGVVLRMGLFMKRARTQPPPDLPVCR